MTTKELRQAIVKLVDEYNNESNAAFDLWTHLPSYQLDKEMPPIEDVMREAEDYIYKLTRRP